MKPRWLLLAVSLILLLVLGPASAFSALGVTIACGEAKVDAVQEDAWDDALWLPMADVYDNYRTASPAHMDVPADGEIGLMNDPDGHFFVFERLELKPEDTDQVDAQHHRHELECEVAFNDEDATGTEWNVDDCDDLALAGGTAGAYEFDMEWDGLAVTHELKYQPMVNDEWCDEGPADGVEAAAAQSDGTAACEWRLDPDDSEFDKIGLGDCFRFAAEIELETWVDDDRVEGGAGFPGYYDQRDLGSYFVICLNPCEPPVEVEEFVPEPATILLFGSGLLGLAGYARLRLRKS